MHDGDKFVHEKNILTTLILDLDLYGFPQDMLVMTCLIHLWEVAINYMVTWVAKWIKSLSLHHAHPSAYFRLHFLPAKVSFLHQVHTQFLPPILMAVALQLLWLLTSLHVMVCVAIVPTIVKACLHLPFCLSMNWQTKWKAAIYFIRLGHTLLIVS